MTPRQIQMTPLTGRSSPSAQPDASGPVRPIRCAARIRSRKPRNEGPQAEYDGGDADRHDEPPTYEYTHGVALPV
ncbi:hypothetical protein, partial [Pseudonocardia sp.]|uniref:hypothetical protein n=1 Tax=Pseudonocardia sp. TaxID=60912 RepID=UPI0031FDF472